MKAYLITTGAIFGMITLAHIARMVRERPGLAEVPWYVLLTLLSAALCAWALILLRKRGR